MDVSFDLRVLSVDGAEVTLEGVPLLFCKACEAIQLPDHAKRLVAFFVEQAKKNGNTTAAIKPTGVLSKRFPLGKVDFPSTMISCPGLSGQGMMAF